MPILLASWTLWSSCLSACLTNECDILVNLHSWLTTIVLSYIYINVSSTLQCDHIHRVHRLCQVRHTDIQTDTDALCSLLAYLPGNIDYNFLLPSFCCLSQTSYSVLNFWNFVASPDSWDKPLLESWNFIRNFMKGILIIEISLYPDLLKKFEELILLLLTLIFVIVSIYRQSAIVSNWKAVSLVS